MRRVLACSDIHGHLYAFKLLLDAVKYNPTEDLLVIPGDLIDRGPDSCATVEECRKLEAKGARLIRGNHEQAMALYLTWHLSEEQYFRGFGGEQTVLSYTRRYGSKAHKKMLEDSRWLNDLPLAFELQNYLFCHAGFDIEKPLYAQEEEFLWGANNFLYNKPNMDKLVIFGHNQAVYLRGDGQFKPWMFKGKICINTGADIGGWLSILELPTGKVYSTECVNTPLPVPNPEKVYPGKVVTYYLNQ